MNHEVQEHRGVLPDSGLCYERAGNQNAALNLVMIHGWTLDARSFTPQLPLAGEMCQTVRYDRRGFGQRRVAPSFDLDFSDLGELVLALQGKVVLYGVSQGARLALRYAALNPDKVAGLIFQGGHVDGLTIAETEVEAIPFARYRALIADGRITDMHREWLQHPLMKPCGADPQALAALIDQYDGQDLLRDGALPSRVDITAELADLRIPVLILTGEHETPSRKKHANYLQQHVPNAMQITVPDAGHLVNWSHPEESNTAISAWCSRYFDIDLMD